MNQQLQIRMVPPCVRGVLDTAAADIEPPPSSSAPIHSDFIAIMGQVRGRFVIMLDVNRAISLNELQAVATGAGAAEVRH